MPFVFEKLIVYQKAVDFAGQTPAATERFPRGYGFLADQLNRASVFRLSSLDLGSTARSPGRSRDVMSLIGAPS